MEENKNQIDQTTEMNINSDAEIPGNNHLSNPEFNDEQDKLQNELEEQKDKYLRLSAEFDNYKRRTYKEKSELIQTAGKDIISSLLEVMDDFDRAEKQMEKIADAEQLKAGTKLVVNKFRNILQQKGVKIMDSLHSDFDVEKHEAISEMEAGDKLKGKVVEEVEKGYYLNDKLIRFAKVVVGK